MKKALLASMGLMVLLPVGARAADIPETSTFASTKPANSTQVPEWLKRKVKPLANVKKPVVVR